MQNAEVNPKAIETRAIPFFMYLGGKPADNKVKKDNFKNLSSCFVDLFDKEKMNIQVSETILEIGSHLAIYLGKDVPLAVDEGMLRNLDNNLRILRDDSLWISPHILSFINPRMTFCIYLELDYLQEINSKNLNLEVMELVEMCVEIN